MTSLRQKIELLHGQGVDLVVVEDFTIELSSRPAEWFAREILGARLRPSAMVVGYDFRFGRGRQGDADALAAWMPELSIEAVRPFLMPGEDRVVSSSAVREAVAQGDVTRAAGSGRAEARAEAAAQRCRHKRAHPRPALARSAAPGATDAHDAPHRSCRW